MQILNGPDDLHQLPPGCVLSVGNFDGLHHGHRRILSTMNQFAAARSAAIVVMTFEPHPLTVLRPHLAPPRLTPPAIKQALLEAAGVTHLVILPPSPKVLGLSAERFWHILRDDVRPGHIVEGNTFNFGKDRQGTIDRLREWTAGTSVQLHVVDSVRVPLLDFTVAPVSSSLVRWLLTYGRARDAAICLGRPYRLRGKVVRGHGRGRSIGIPTANLKCDDQLILADGVYAARCETGGRTHAVALSIGTLPTFGDSQRQVEAHILSFDANLYDREIDIDVVDWLREQRKFSGVEELKLAIARDVKTIASRANLNPAEPTATLAG